MKKIVICLVLLWGCSPNSLEDFHHEGQALVKNLIEELKAIQNREQLQKELPGLKSQFEELVDLMIAARKYQESHPEEEIFDYASFDDELLEEIKRIYKIEKGKELIEQAQREALLRLDAFHRTIAKRKSLIK